MGKRENFERFLKAREKVALPKSENAKVGFKVVSAERQVAKLNEIPIENQSTLIKYRQNITVPAVWLGEQGVRLNNIPMIPAEKISNLNTYIQTRLIKIDGGNLDDL